jgi:hypothetical protein
LLVAQNLGRADIPGLGRQPWTALLVIARLWAVISASVMLVSVRDGMRQLVWGWTASLMLGLLVATFSFWRM